MVEIHREERKALPAIGTRYVPHLLHQGRLLAPTLTLDDWLMTSLKPQAAAFESLRVGACTMTVRADDLALLELRPQPLLRDAAGSLK